jgi:hypothetical protein
MNFFTSAAKAAVISLVVALPLFAQDPWTDSSIETTAPKAGTIYHVGDTIRTQWTVHNNATPGGGLVVSISPNAGYNWVVIITETLKKGDTKYYQNDSQGTFVWVIPDSIQLWINHNVSSVSDSCMMMVGAPYDEVFAPSYTGIFSIKGSSAVKMPFRSGQNPDALLIEHNQNISADANKAGVFSINGKRLGLKNPAASGVSIIRFQNQSNTSPSLKVHTQE